MVPETATITQRPEFDVPFNEFEQMPVGLGYVGMSVLRPVMVGRQRGEFYVKELKEKLRNGILKRNPDGTYNRINRKFNERSYATEEIGLESRLDERRRRMFPDLASAESDAVNDLFDDILRGIEQESVDLLDNLTTFVDAAGVDTWRDHAGAEPLTDITVAKKSIYDATGLIPNAVVMSYADLLDFVLCDQVTNRFKGQPFIDARVGMMLAQLDVLASHLGVEKVFVAGAVQNTADYGQDVEIESFWTPGHIGVYRIAMGEDMKQACVGRTYIWGGDGSSIAGVEPQLAVESYRENQTRSDVFRARFEFKPDVIYPEAGYIVTGTQEAP
jgi:hypothetical protein